MRILGEDDDKTQSKVTLYLTKSEAGELKDSLNALLEGPPDSHHHISSSDFSKEITVCLYSEDDAKALSHFDERSRKVILHDA